MKGRSDSVNLTPIDAEAVEHPVEFSDPVRRFERTVGPVIGGLIIDSIDLFSFGPLGIFGGALIGGSVAYYIASIEKLPVWQRTLLAIAACLYCAYPGANFIPVATLIGAILKFIQDGKRKG